MQNRSDEFIQNDLIHLLMMWNDPITASKPINEFRKEYEKQGYKCFDLDLPMPGFRYELLDAFVLVYWNEGRIVEEAVPIDLSYQNRYKEGTK